MKYLGEERNVQVKTQSERPILYIKCDKCGKRIEPGAYNMEGNRYVRIHTWHSDWGNDSIDSHEYGDYCPECAKEVVAEYIEDMGGSEELELSNEYLGVNETVRRNYSYLTEGYTLAEGVE